MVRYICLLVFALTNYTCIAQVSDGAILIWSKNRNLNWSDFNYQELITDKSKAISHLNIIVKGFWDKSFPNFTVISTFNTQKSWTNDTISSNLLKHEILHFDITEVYARRIRKSIFELRNDNEINTNKYYERIKFFLKQCEKTQTNYDDETSHGVYLNAQERWHNKIHKELKSLYRYSLE